MRGTIKHWNTQKGYGFIKPQGNGPDVFAHITEIHQAISPSIGQAVSFELKVRRGAQQATNIVLQDVSPRQRWFSTQSHWWRRLSVVAFFGVLLSIVTLFFMRRDWVPWPILLYAVASFWVFCAYHTDKRAAQKSRRRISEGSLFFGMLIGGWPGALLASGLFRHKTIKRAYRFTFWSIVGLHVGFWYAWFFLARCGLHCDEKTFALRMLWLLRESFN